MRTTAIMNLKGGTAKTVTAINVAAILARDHCESVLLVDADSQCNLTEFMAADKIELGTLADLLRGDPAAPVPTKVKGVSLIAADDSMMSLDVSAARSGVANPMALANYLADRDRKYDHCIIDCPPAFSAGAMAALIAADSVVIPMKVDAFGIRGMKNLLEQIRNMQRINRDLEVAGVLPTMVYPDKEQKEAEEMLRQTLSLYGIRCFRHIRRSVTVDKMTFLQAPLVDSAPKGKVTYDYRVFVRALLAAEESGPEAVDFEGGARDAV